MVLPIATRSLLALAVSVGAATSNPIWAQHGGHGGGHHSGGHAFGHHYGGHHYGGYGFGGFGHGWSHHYQPYFYSGYYGLGYGAYGYNSWPYSYTPRVYSYAGTPVVDVAPPTDTLDAFDPTAAATGATAAGLRYQRAAESAFRSHHYDEAIEWAKRAAGEMPRDGRLFLLLSQAHLAVGEYRDAAGAARLGMSLLPAEDWGYVVENFRNFYHDADYVAQVRRLQQFSSENPSHADARFLLGYHWVFLGQAVAANREAYVGAARRELSQAGELNPRDEWTNRLLELIDGPRPAPALPGSRLPAGPTTTNDARWSADASIEYPPPQEFEQPLKSGGAAIRQHEHQK